MVKAESYRQRTESEGGLSFIEFNYMLLQAFDFLTLFDRHDCSLQMRGSDQWGNILAGVELVRKSRQKTVFGPRKNENKNAIELPTTCVSRNELTKGLPAYALFFRTGLTQSGGEARRLISQGGAYINEETVAVFDLLVDSSHFKDGEILLRASKKRFHRIRLLS